MYVQFLNAGTFSKQDCFFAIFTKLQIDNTYKDLEKEVPSLWR